MQYANVSLMRQSDSVLVGYTSANEKGEFQLQQIPNGSYRMVVFFVGYENHQQELVVSKDMDLGTIKIKPGTATIGEVVVKGERPLFAVDGEKTYYNTAEDPTVQTGTASDVLQNAPGVSVDVEGNVTLRGTSSVEIWINDKPSHMNAENLKTYLQQMPANSIDHVEVITNPSARYGSKADGIINIVTTTKVMRNQFISFGANASIKPYASPWISYVWSNEKLSINLYSNFSYSMDRYRNMSDRRLQLFKTFAAYDLQVFHTILDPVFLECFQLGNVFLAQSKDEGAVVLIRKIEFFSQLRIHLAAKQVVLGHQRAVCCVKSGVYDRRIGLGCAGTDILCPLQDTERPFESGEETGYGTAGHARSDNDYIIHE